MSKGGKKERRMKERREREEGEGKKKKKKTKHEKFYPYNAYKEIDIIYFE